MTPLPKKKSTRGRTNRRRSTQKVSLGSIIKCSNCGKLKLPHRSCPHCNTYK